MFQGKPGKVRRGAICVREYRDANERKNDKRKHLPDEAAGALWLSYGVLRV